MDKMSMMMMNPFMGDIKFVKMPLKSSCCLVPWYFLSFIFSAAASIIIGFATEWDIGVRDDVKRKFYEYYSLGAIFCFFSLVFFCLFARIILVTCLLNKPDDFKEENICCQMMIFISIYGGAFAVVFVLFGLIMDEVIKIPSFVLTILGAVFEGIMVLKSCCSSCCCSEKDNGSVISAMKVLGDLIDLAMFILWTIKLATSSLSLPFLVVGILKVVASTLSMIADTAKSVKSEGCNVSIVLVGLCSSTGIISQAILFPLRADGYITIHYAWCTTVVAIGFSLFALVVLVSACCGYTLLVTTDAEDEDGKVEAVEVGDVEEGVAQGMEMS